MMVLCLISLYQMVSVEGVYPGTVCWRGLLSFGDDLSNFRRDVWVIAAGCSRVPFSG